MSQQTIERLVTALLAAVIAVVWLAPASAQAPTAAKTTSPGTTKTWSPPRTPWGHPDLQGMWTNMNDARTPFNRPEELAARNVTDPKSPELLKQKHAEAPAAEAERIRNRNLQGTEAPGRPVGGGPPHWFESNKPLPSRLWLVTDPPDFKMPPLTSEAQKRLAARRTLREGTLTADEPPPGGWVDDLDPWVRCITRGLPEMYIPSAYNANYQIVQEPGYVAILHEMIHETRVIPLDGRGRPHLPPNIRQWLGDSRGRWEGNTLVVDTTNFTNNINTRGAFSEGIDENLHLIERFTPVAPGKIEHEVTVDDPTGFTKPWTFAMTWTKDDTQKEILEYACHEGNKSIPNILSGTRAQEKAKEEAAQKAPR